MIMLSGSRDISDLVSGDLVVASIGGLEGGLEGEGR